MTNSQEGKFFSKMRFSKMRPRASHKIFLLTQSATNLPVRMGEMWKKIMTEAINLKIKFTQKHQTALLLKKLRRKNQGTNDIEYYIRNIKNISTKKRIRRSILSAKIQDACYSEQRAREKFKRKLEYLKRRIGQDRELYDSFNNIMQEEVEAVWKKGLEKGKKKISHLIEKWRSKRPKVPGEYKGVLISTEELEKKFEDPGNEVLNYGDVELSDAEKKIMEKGPKFTTYGQISKVEMESASEVMVDKIRWETRRRQERGGPWTVEDELEKVLAKTVLNEEEGTMDFSKQRVTDIPECRRIKSLSQ